MICIFDNNITLSNYWAAMNILDIILGGILAWGAIRGFQKGLILQVASLVALVLGVYCSVEFSHIAADFLDKQFTLDSNVTTILSFVVTFSAVIIGVHLLAKLIEGAFKLVALGFINKLMGAAFGVLKMALILSVLLSVLYQLETTVQLIDSKTKARSVLYHPVRKIAPTIVPSIRSLVQEKKEEWLVLNG